MSTKTLVLEVRWSWDHAHDEFVTISLEEPEDQSLLGDVLRTGLPNSVLYNELYKLFRALDRSIMGRGQMVALYLQEQESRRDLAVKGTFELSWHLKPLCRFNLVNQPIPLE